MCSEHDYRMSVGSSIYMSIFLFSIYIMILGKLVIRFVQTEFTTMGR